MAGIVVPQAEQAASFVTLARTVRRGEMHVDRSILLLPFLCEKGQALPGPHSAQRIVLAAEHNVARMSPACRR